MNILYLCDEYPPGRHGGIGTAVQLLAREMVKKGHRVVVAGFCDWGYGGEDTFEDKGVKVFRFRRLLASAWFHSRDSLRVRATYKLFKMTGLFQYDLSRSLERYRQFLERLISEYKIDIVEKPEFNEYVQYCKTVTPFPQLSVPTIVKLHGSITYILRENGIEPDHVVFGIEKQVIQDADAISAVSLFSAETANKYFDNKKLIEVVYNGVEIPELPPMTKRPMRVVYAGALREKKGVFQLMKAWNQVSKVLPQAELILLGNGHVEKVRTFLDSDAKRSVRFKGHVGKEELFANFSEAEVAVFPSYAETFGLAVIEAMLCGTATISTNRGAGPEIIRDGIDGTIVDPDDVAGIAEKIIELLKDEALRRAQTAARVYWKNLRSER
jgi:glycosyltransferase involved in cell wall biosynthesis